MQVQLFYISKNPAFFYCYWDISIDFRMIFELFRHTEVGFLYQ